MAAKNGYDLGRFVWELPSYRNYYGHTIHPAAFADYLNVTRQFKLIFVYFF